MSALNIIIVVSILIILFGLGMWFTNAKFKNIEDGETKRRKDIEQDAQVDERKTKND